MSDELDPAELVQVDEDEPAELVAGLHDHGRPVPLVEGTFAVFQGPKGEVILVTNIEGRGEEKKVFPRALIRFAQHGPLGAMLRRANGD